MQFARHYRFAVVQARVRKPKDKAHAEAGVLLAERWVLARLRKRVFFSLDELNEALRELQDAWECQLLLGSSALCVISCTDEDRPVSNVGL